ncbi:transcriptional regulator [Mycobacterium uberis]|uniref:Transcriptional regulator n=1 Tax=Mycobacterium uberis TaxID=2162698 RepID=A0A3E1HE48_9MYCO|nr:PucR family transcriptional regulator [Mycobacterium uberis]RFD24534.1 transcriptional regulator [Mycobacterium uberis]
MARQHPSPQVRKLIREGARIALNPSQEWIDQLDHATVTANPAIANDPVLAKVVRRASRAHLVHWATANLRDPGAPVPANVGPEPLTMARDLVRRGRDVLALDIYRVGEYMAWRRWIDIAFKLTSDPQELREMLDVSAQSINEYVAATLEAIAAQIQLEHDELTRSTHAERLEVVDLILEGAPVTQESAEARLSYRLGPTHTAAVIWSDDLDGDHGYLDQAAKAFSHVVGSAQQLIVVASAAARWVWLADAVALDVSEVQKRLLSLPKARVAIGTSATGIEGFRRSHLEALTTQRTLTRLKLHQQVAFFTDVQLVSLITQNPAAAKEFITNTLGDFESASPALQQTLLTFINEQCNASRAAKRLFTHRNTLLRRIESAEKLLPRPLDHASVHIAVALEALQWRGGQTTTSDPHAGRNGGVSA